MKFIQYLTQLQNFGLFENHSFPNEISKASFFEDSQENLKKLFEKEINQEKEHFYNELYNQGIQLLPVLRVYLVAKLSILSNNFDFCAKLAIDFGKETSLLIPLIFAKKRTTFSKHISLELLPILKEYDFH